MAGSFNHINGDDGEFTMDLIENMGDAHEALQECHWLIRRLLPLAQVAVTQEVLMEALLRQMYSSGEHL